MAQQIVCPPASPRTIRRCEWAEPESPGFPLEARSRAKRIHLSVHCVPPLGKDQDAVSEINRPARIRKTLRGIQPRGAAGTDSTAKLLRSTASNRRVSREHCDRKEACAKLPGLLPPQPSRGDGGSAPAGRFDEAQIDIADVICPLPTTVRWPRLDFRGLLREATPTTGSPGASENSSPEI